jgi:hypothetical protein
MNEILGISICCLIGTACFVIFFKSVEWFEKI